MPNTHTTPDTLAEIQAREADLLPACLLTLTGLTVPAPPGMTLPATAATAYVREASTPARLTYVQQAGIPIVLTGADGNYYLAVHKDTWTDVASWTRRPGSHYLWRSSATHPGHPPSGLTVARIVVAGGVVTGVEVSTVTPQGHVAYGGANGALTFDLLFQYDDQTHQLALPQAQVTQALGVGQPPTMVATLHVQPQAPVAFQVNDYTVGGQAISYVSQVQAGPNRWNLYMSGTAQNYLAGPLGIGVPGAVPSYPLHVVGAIYGTTTMGLGAPPGSQAALDIQPLTPVGVQVENFFHAGSGSAIAYAGLVAFSLGSWNCYMSGTAANYFAGNIGLNTTSVTTWQLHVNGTIACPGGTVINSTSHAALKQAIRPLTDASALIARLPVRQWEWADPAVEAQLPGTQAGFVVEELAQVKPEWVRTGDDGQTGLAMVGLDAHLVAAVQDLLCRVATLEGYAGGA